ncbi:MAG: diguanylate cyclase [Candidatus Omnitrophota bacterium]
MTGIDILVVEDNQEAARELEEMITALGYKCWIASDPREVKEMVKTTNYPVVLTELRMPHTNGVQLTQSILNVSPATSVLVMTAYSFISFAVEAMEAGAYGYITKPFNPAEIRIVLQRAVEKYSMMLTRDKQEYLMGLSVKDGLTGVYNRRVLDVQLKNKITMFRTEVYKKFSILMIDVDNFKEYNDTQGHQAGDELLKELAKLFQDTVRAGDIVFRYGGEEFCIMLDGSNKKEAMMVGERIRTIVSLYVPTTISLGVSTFPDDGDNQADLISRADNALYCAKRTGKNKVVPAESSLEH